MHNKLQFNRNAFTKKEVQKLLFQFKLSLINSNYSKNSESDLSDNLKSSVSSHTLPLEKDDTDNSIDSISEDLNQRIDSLDAELQQQIQNFDNLKKLLRDRLSQQVQNQKNREQQMKDLTLKRKAKIQTLKRQIDFLIKSSLEHGKYIFDRMKTQFGMSVDQFIQKFRKMKSQWKLQLKGIINKLEQAQKDKGQHDLKQSSYSTTLKNQLEPSLDTLQQQINKHFFNAQEQSINLKLQLSALLQQYNKKKTEAQEKITNNFAQFIAEAQKLEKTIKIELKNEHIQSEEIRQKFLLVFEQNSDRVFEQNRKKQTEKLSGCKWFQLQCRRQGQE